MNSKKALGMHIMIYKGKLYKRKLKSRDQALFPLVGWLMMSEGWGDLQKKGKEMGPCVASMRPRTHLVDKMLVSPSDCRNEYECDGHCMPPPPSDLTLLSPSQLILQCCTHSFSIYSFYLLIHINLLGT